MASRTLGEKVCLTQSLRLKKATATCSRRPFSKRVRLFLSVTDHFAGHGAAIEPREIFFH
jgi:hypothetical protein